MIAELKCTGIVDSREYHDGGFTSLVETILTQANEVRAISGDTVFVGMAKYEKEHSIYFCHDGSVDIQPMLPW